MNMQGTLFDSLEAQDQIYGIGDVVYYLVLDRVRKCTVEGTFEYKDHLDPFGPPTCRYHAVLESGGHHTFGKYDVGSSIFDSYEDAEKRGAENLIDLGVSVVRSDHVIPDEYTAYREKEPREGCAHPLYGCCALVGGTMVYRKDAFCYNFLDEYGDEKAARKAYRKAAAKLKQDFGRRESDEAEFEACDCYGKGDGHWAACDYAYNNWYGGLCRL